MNNMILTGEFRKKVELSLITLCSLLYLSRIAIPFFKYPFLILFGFVLFYIIVMHGDRIFPGLISLMKNLPLVIILSTYLLISFLFSDKIYLLVIKDLINIIVLLTIILMLKIFITDSRDFKLFYKTFLYQAIFFALIISMQRIYTFIYQSSYSDLFNDMYIDQNRVVVDRNFVLLPVFFGMLSILRIFYHKVTGYKIFIYTVILFIFSIEFILSGSKRGEFVFIFIIVFILILQVWNLFIKNHKINQFCRNIRFYIFSYLFFFISLILLFSTTSVYFKNRILASIGVKNISFTKNLLSQTITRYVSFLDKEFTDDYVYSVMWHPIFDPMDPETAMGSGNFKITNRLEGKKAEIVPQGSKGYLLDNTCLGFATAHHSYYFLSIIDEHTNYGDSLNTSIYCYVSDDFDGDLVALRALGPVVNNPDSFYDMKNKGVWQKLSLPLSCKEGNININLYMAKGGEKDFSNLKGSVIFAYPEIQRIKINASCRNKSSLSKQSENIFKGFTSITDMSRTEKKVAWAGFINLSLVNVLLQINPVTDKDQIRNWMTKIVSEDTTYHRYKTNLNFEKPKKNFGDDRTVLWKFALEIFTKEFKWDQKLFGGGFNFLNWYGSCFDGDKTKSDYPHNPFLHILLYSGILGLMIYIYFIYRVIYLYLRYFKECQLFFYFFLIAYFFTFFSGGSPFDPPVLGFLLIIPFFISSVYEKNYNEEEINIKSSEK